MFKESICFVSMLMGHHTCPDEKVIAVKCSSRDGIVICHTHAANERGKTHIRGMVEKSFGAGSVSDGRKHLDITVTRKSKVIQTIATDFFPRTIPATSRGIPGRSTFGLKMNELPLDAEIAVTIHPLPIRDCPHYAKN